MKKQIISFFLLGGSALFLHAQNVAVSARVVDVETGEALPSATVVIDSEKSTITNTDGDFVIEAAPQEDLTVSYVGYKSFSMKVSNVGTVIKLTPYAVELDEVKVRPLKSILEKVTSRLKEETAEYKKQESNFYYRQTTLNDGECCEYVESFLNGYSEVALRQPSVITGRYGALKRTDNKRYSYVGNYYEISCISPYSPHKIDKKKIIVPLMLNSEEKYHIDYDILTDKSNGNVIYKIVFTPHSKVQVPIVKGVIYVDADSYKIPKFEGEFLHNYIVSNKKERFDSSLSFSVAYTYHRGFMEINSVTTKSEYSQYGISVSINSTLVNVGQKYYKGKRKLGTFSNLKDKIFSAGYNAQFWKDNTVIKRTPLEEQVMKMFEKDNVFSNISE